MFINDQYLLNQHMSYRYQATMEDMYYRFMPYKSDADTLLVMMIGA
jgi:hypothetical protein